MKKIIILAAAAAALCACGSSRKMADVYRTGDSDDSGINVGYGTVSKDELTYSVSQLEIDEREAVTYTDIWDYMRGRVPGVSIDYAEGGQTPNITVRGISSINSSTQPLILVDGVETPDISYLKPYDVGSVSVLKDASAAIYGTRGGNGVILITPNSAYEAAKLEAQAKKEAREAARAARQAKKEEKKNK